MLYAGCGRADITPEVGGLLYGYNDDTYSTACHDHLEIKALALKNENEDPVVMLSFSVGDFGTGACTETREVLSRELGLPIERILASATHTHSAPNVSGIAGWGDVDRPYLEGILIPGAINAAKEAISSLQAAEFAVCDGDLIVMCTDGICTDPESDEDGGAMRLVDFLEHEYMHDIHKIAEGIVADTVRARGRSDDMTVGVFRVRKKGSTRRFA